MGPTWVLSDPGRPHVGPMNLVIRDVWPLLTWWPKDPATYIPGTAPGWLTKSWRRIYALPLKTLLWQWIVKGQSSRTGHHQTLKHRYQIICKLSIMSQTMSYLATLQHIMLSLTSYFVSHWSKPLCFALAFLHNPIKSMKCSNESAFVCFTISLPYLILYIFIEHLVGEVGASSPLGQVRHPPVFFVLCL